MAAPDNPGRRELGKQARRKALLDVARAILEEGDLSMRQLADRAGVAHATPYNLFGSKHELLAALYVDQRDRLEARLVATPDPLARILAAVDLIADDLAGQPHFHRGLYRAIYRADTSRSDGADGADSGVHFWIAQIVAADRAGCFLPGTRIDLLSRCVVNLITGAMLDWTEHRVEARAWGAGVRYGLALMTLPVVSHPSRALLEESLRTLQGEEQR